MKDFKDKLKNLPLCPGVYLMKDINGQIIYVGKSKALKNRVSQYFQTSKAHSQKTVSMVSNVDDFEYIITDTESEALALECNLIKKYRPKYNILLKDDKQYPYIKITTSEPFPRIFITRRVVKDGSTYFGPYMSSYCIKNTLETIKKIFMVRSCNLSLPSVSGNKKPCLYYHIRQCCAPCTGKISSEEYKDIFNKISDVLKGNYKQISNFLTKKMTEASDGLEFEKAAILRDKISALEILSNEQKISSAKEGNADIIGMYNDILESCIEIFYMRHGKIVGSEHFTFKNNLCSEKQMLEDFVKQFYFTVNNIPGEIIVPFALGEDEDISNWLSGKAGHRVRFTIPKKGAKLNLLHMVSKNAEEALKNEKYVKNRDIFRQNKILTELKKLLNLNNVPYKIECYDISNISGTNNVGAQIVYSDAIPQKKLYRLYNIKGVEGANDYECMKQTIFRRFSKAYEEEDKIRDGLMTKAEARFFPLPDLILLDGGKTHVSVVKEVLDGLGEEVPVYGLVKDEKHKTRGIVDEKSEFLIDKKSELFRFLSNMQEEVHRYAISRFRKKHEKSSVKSVLEEIDGVGEKKHFKLLKYFAGIKNIENATLEDLERVIDKRTAKNVYNYFHS